MIRNLLQVVVLFSFLISYSIFAQQACDKAEMFKPLLGEWSAYHISESKKTHLGQLSTQLIVDGCALRQRFNAADTDLSNNFNYESLVYINERGRWLEIVVSSSGDVRHYRWEQSEEEFVIEQRGNTGLVRNRLVLFDLAEDQYQLLAERSEDRGETWTSNNLMQLIRTSLQVQAD